MGHLTRFECVVFDGVGGTDDVGAFEALDAMDEIELDVEG